MDDVTAAAEPTAHDPVEMMRQLYRSVPSLMDPVRILGDNISVYHDDGSVKLCVMDPERKHTISGIPYAALFEHHREPGQPTGVAIELRGLGRHKLAGHHITNATSPRDLLAQAVAWYKQQIQNLPKQAQAAAEPPYVPGREATDALTAIIQRGGAQRALVHGRTFYVRLYGGDRGPVTVDLDLTNSSTRFTRIAPVNDAYFLRLGTGQDVLAKLPIQGATATSLMRWAVQHTYAYAKAHGWFTDIAEAAAEPTPKQVAAESTLLADAIAAVWKRLEITVQPQDRPTRLDYCYVDVHEPRRDVFFGFTVRSSHASATNPWRNAGSYVVRVRDHKYVLDDRGGYGKLLELPAATNSAEAVNAVVKMLRAVVRQRTHASGLQHTLRRRDTKAEAAAEPTSTELHKYPALLALLERARSKRAGFDVGAFIVAESTATTPPTLVLITRDSPRAQDSLRLGVDPTGERYVLMTAHRSHIAYLPVVGTTARTLMRWALQTGTGYASEHGWITGAATEPQNDNHIKMVFERLLRMFPTAMEGEGYKHVTTDIVGWREHNTDMFLAVLGDRTAPKATLHLYRTAPGYAVEVSTGTHTADPVLDITTATTPADMLKQALVFYRDHLRSRHVQAATEPDGSRARDLLNKLQVHQGAHSPEQEVAPHLFTGGRVTTKQLQSGVGVTVDVVMDLSTEPHHQGAGTGYWFNVYVDIRMIRGKLIMTEVTFGSYGPHVEADKPGIDVTNMDVRHVLATAQVSAAVFTRKWLPEAIHHYTRDDRRFQALRDATPVTAAAEPSPENMDTSDMHTTLFRYKAEFNVAGETVNVHYVDDFPEHRVSAMYGVYGRHLGLGFVDVHVASGKLHVRTRSLLVGYDKQTNKAYKLPASLSPDSFHRFLGAVFTKLQSGVFRDWLAHAPAQAAAEPHTGPGIRDSFKELVRGFHQERKVQLPGFHGEVHVRAERTGTADPTLDALVLQVQDRSYIARWFPDHGFVHISENNPKARDFRKFTTAMTPAELLRQLLVFAVTDYRSRQT